MTTMTINHISMLSNPGQAKQQDLAFALTGEIRKPDAVRFDMDSDIPEFSISVKSARFTLASASALSATTFEGQLNEFSERVHSEKFAYVTKNNMVYIMDKVEFLDFCHEFCGWEQESEKNGGAYKVRCRKESKRMIKWLQARA